MNRSSLTSASNERGFTLIEILIAITLLSFITLGVVSITENATITKERTTEINKNNLQIETAMSRFEWDFSQIYSPLYFSQLMDMNSLLQGGAQGGGQPGVNSGVNAGTNGGTSGDGGDDGGGGGTQTQGGTQNGMDPQRQAFLQEYFQSLAQRFERNEHFVAVSQEGLPIPRFYSPEKDSFEFFTSSNRRKVENVRQSHFSWVKYTLVTPDTSREEAGGAGSEPNPDIPKSLKDFVRYFSAEDPYGDKRLDPDTLKAAVLLQNVESLEFQFWDPNRKRWETSLRSIPQGESLIRGVKLTIAWYDSMGIKRVTSRIFRNHWPMVVPVNQTQRPAGNQAGAQSGAQAGAQGGNLGGAQGGGNADEN